MEMQKGSTIYERDALYPPDLALSSLPPSLPPSLPGDRRVHGQSARRHLRALPGSRGPGDGGAQVRDSPCLPPQDQRGVCAGDGRGGREGGREGGSEGGEGARRETNAQEDGGRST